MRKYSIEKEKKFWNSLAKGYDGFVKKIAGKTYNTIFTNLKKDVAGAGHVLEIATGTGLIAFEIGDSVNRVTAIDFAPEMIRVAKEKCLQQNNQNIDFLIGNATNLEFQNNFFDLIVASNVMHILPEPRLALHEMKRVLKDDGKIILPTTLHGANLQSKILSQLVGISGFQARNRWSVASFREFITGNGFHILKEKMIPDKIPLIYIVVQKTIND